MSEEFPYYTPAEFLRMRTILEETRKERDEARERVTTMTEAWVKSTASEALLRKALRRLQESARHYIYSDEAGPILMRIEEACAALENTKEASNG